jgi:carboxylesterase type B
MPQKGSIEDQMIRKMTSMWASFMLTGDPNNPLLNAEAQWEKVTGDTVQCLSISEKCIEMIPLPEQKKLDVWNSIFNEENVLIY